MRAGLLNHYASIQERTSNKAGDTWAELRKQWLNITPVNFSKLLFFSAQGSKVTHSVLARETPELHVGQRIVYRGENFHITHVQHVFGDRQEADAELVQGD